MLGPEQRNSVPQNLEEEQIQPFLQQLMTSSEAWRAIKLVILGNGRIGKTTMLHAVRRILHEVQACIAFFPFLFSMPPSLPKNGKNHYFLLPLDKLNYTNST